MNEVIRAQRITKERQSVSKGSFLFMEYFRLLLLYEPKVHPERIETV